jgi:hypothetical protein
VRLATGAAAQIDATLHRARFHASAFSCALSKPPALRRQNQGEEAMTKRIKQIGSIVAMTALCVVLVHVSYARASNTPCSGMKGGVSH